MSAVGAPVRADENLRWIVGPPLRQTFRQTLGSDERALQALLSYREHYSAHGVHASQPFPDVIGTLRTIHDSGYRLFLATSKLTEFAITIIEQFGVVDVFAGICGSLADGRFDRKQDLIHHLLTQEEIEPKSCVMIGDREHNVIGASANGVPRIGVTWRYGGTTELVRSNATLICETPRLLPAMIDQLMASRNG